jgi:caa(3)-type oxidase subunit IV
MSASHAAHHDDHDGHAGHGAAHGPARYIKIWAVLCVLLVISVLGPELEIQVVTLITAFGIAGVKAYLVMKEFMHLDVEKPIIWYILATGVVFIGMFFAAVSVDVMNHDGARWSNDAAKRAVVAGLAAGDPANHHGAAEHHDAEGAGEAAPAHH